MAKVEKRACSACGTALPERSIAALKDDKTMTCETCQAELVLHRRSRLMRFAWRALVLSALAITGCAKFPANGTGTTYTRVSFRIRVAGKINTTQDADPLTNYLYFVAIRASSDDNPDSTTNPQPVFAVNPNGFVGGQPTHFVEFASGYQISGQARPSRKNVPPARPSRPSPSPSSWFS